MKVNLVSILLIISCCLYGQNIGVTGNPLKKALGVMVSPDVGKLSPLVAYEYGSYKGEIPTDESYFSTIHIHKYSAGISYHFHQKPEIQSLSYFNVVLCYNDYNIKPNKAFIWSFEVGPTVTFGAFLTGFMFDPLNREGKVQIGIKL